MAERWQCSLYRGFRAQREQGCSPAPACSCSGFAARRGRTPRCSAASGRPSRPWGASSALAGPPGPSRTIATISPARMRVGVAVVLSCDGGLGLGLAATMAARSTAGYGALGGRAAGGGGRAWTGAGRRVRDVRGSWHVMAVDERLDRYAIKAQFERMTYALDGGAPAGDIGFLRRARRALLLPLIDRREPATTRGCCRPSASDRWRRSPASGWRWCRRGGGGAVWLVGVACV